VLGFISFLATIQPLIRLPGPYRSGTGRRTKPLRLQNYSFNSLTRLLPSSGFRIPEFRRIGNSPEPARHSPEAKPMADGRERPACLALRSPPANAWHWRAGLFFVPARHWLRLRRGGRVLVYPVKCYFFSI